MQLTKVCWKKIAMVWIGKQQKEMLLQRAFNMDIEYVEDELNLLTTSDTYQQAIWSNFLNVFWEMRSDVILPWLQLH